MVREGDFRASGSGNIVYDPKEIPPECIKIAFDITKKIKAQCIAYDFVFLDNKPLIIEASYGFSSKGYLLCLGYWNNKFIWVEETFTPEFFMISDILESIK